MKWRVVSVVLVLCMACSSTLPNVELADGGTDVATTIADPPPSTASPSTAPKPPKADPELVSDSTMPGTAPSTGLDAESAVISGVIVMGGEFDGGTREFRGYGPAEAQTDCAAFDLFDTRIAYSGFARLQGGDGFNLDHDVFDVGVVDGGVGAQEFADAAGQVARKCPTMAWLEGGAVENTSLTAELPEGWVGYLQVEVGNDQYTQVGVRARDNLLSVVTLITWGRPLAESDTNLFLAAVVAADEQLDSAEPSRRPPPTTAPPRTTAPPTSVPKPVVPNTTAPTTTILPTEPTSAPESAGPIGILFLDEDDVARPLYFETVTIDRVEFEECEDPDLFLALLGGIQLGATSGYEDNAMFAQAVGLTDSPILAAEAVGRVDELVPCAIEDLGEITFTVLTDLPVEAVEASVLTFQEDDEQFELVFVLFDPNVVVYFLNDSRAGLEIDELIELVAAKMQEYEAALVSGEGVEQE